MKKKKSSIPPASLAASDSDRLFHDMKMDAARALAMDPQNVRALAQAIASTPTGTDPEPEPCELLAMTLDQARMAQEDGQHFGKQCLDALSDHLAALSANGTLTLGGSMAITRCYVRAGLPVPESLAPDEQAVLEETSAISLGDHASPEAAFAAILDELVTSVGHDPSLLHQTFAEVLPGIPAPARRMLCALAAANPDPRFEALACAWLLDPSEPVRDGAREGLANRLAAGKLSAQALGRLAVLRTWITHKPTRQRVDTLIKSAIRTGLAPAQDAPPAPRITGCVSSPIDGVGSQSLGIALQKGRTRSIATVLLKQGFGVKDAYLAPCANAAEQRDILRQITFTAEKGDVSLAYVQSVLGLALADGLANGVSPAPGLVDIVDACAIADLRPAEDASVQALLHRYDPEGALASLDAETCERLVAASADWPADYPVLASWLEDNEALRNGTGSSTARMDAVWALLETRRTFWATLVARTALLLKDRDDPLADSFAITAREMINGLPLRQIPIMVAIMGQTLEPRYAAFPDLDDDVPEPSDEEIMVFLRDSMATPPRKSASKKPK
ncbi:hypothetical protein [Gluconacetobacter takamatsuzukensis]|uniref:Uncharacterized protein n=1 Tax=Gluconacetobacter takamatsuzukensis TaxID=1286190 RepID=A0A7W4PNI1_9PROT|nr:hypothetical protein [Gluconacetobacter takamatsuzukensis]MBB2204577.1 hypothetical protein [Gluconacetobacter takamatsuzukensis]